MVYSDMGVGWERWSYIKGALCLIFLVLCHESVTMVGAAVAAVVVVYFDFNTFVLKKRSQRLFFVCICFGGLVSGQDDVYRLGWGCICEMWFLPVYKGGWLNGCVVSLCCPSVLNDECVI